MGPVVTHEVWNQLRFFPQVEVKLNPHADSHLVSVSYVETTGINECPITISVSNVALHEIPEAVAQAMEELVTQIVFSADEETEEEEFIHVQEAE